MKTNDLILLDQVEGMINEQTFVDGNNFQSESANLDQIKALDGKICRSRIYHVRVVLSMSGRFF